MRIVIAAVGRMKTGAERDLYDRYVSRAAKTGRNLGLSGPDLIEMDEGRQRDAGQRKQDETSRLLAAVPAGKLIALDEHGKSYSTRQLTDQLTRWRDDAIPTCSFLIGGADGHDGSLKGRADLTLSFGAMTWPHMLVRIMLAEQIYRVCTLLAGHPYHRD